MRHRGDEERAVEDDIVHGERESTQDEAAARRTCGVCRPTFGCLSNSRDRTLNCCDQCLPKAGATRFIPLSCLKQIVSSLGVKENFQRPLLES